MAASSLRACPVTMVCLATRRSDTARQAMTSLRTAKSDRMAAAFRTVSKLVNRWPVLVLVRLARASAR